MNAYRFPLAGADLALLPSGALAWEARRLLCVSDLHLGRSERFARNAGALLPPYEARDTLARLEADIAATARPDSGLPRRQFRRRRRRRRARRRGADRGSPGSWPGGAGSGSRAITIPARSDSAAAIMPNCACRRWSFATSPTRRPEGEISGHYHPKVRIAGRSRPCLLHDATRAILPAYGTYTGGLKAGDAALAALMGPDARAVMTGAVLRPIPMPRPA